MHSVISLGSALKYTTASGHDSCDIGIQIYIHHLTLAFISRVPPRPTILSAKLQPTELWTSQTRVTSGKSRSFTRLQWISRVISNRLHQSYSRRLEKIWPSLTSLACTVCLTSSLIYLKHFQTKMQLYLGLNFGTFEALFQKSKLLYVLYPPIFRLKVPLNFWIWSSCPPLFYAKF